MEKVRKPFQGVLNIIRFNWHLYVLALGLAVVSLGFAFLVAEPYSLYATIGGVLVIVSTATSLLVSFYVYDVSGLYNMEWLGLLRRVKKGRIANIHAGFDETSELLQQHFPTVKLEVFDFYNPERHTEISIRRARKAFPNPPKTKAVSTSQLPVANNKLDVVFLVFAAHEIRDRHERIAFFKEVKRILKKNGQVVVVEHLRNVPNYFAYTVGAFHFFTRYSWYRTFQKSNLRLHSSSKINPFVTLFILENGNSSKNYRKPFMPYKLGPSGFPEIF